MSNTMDNRGTSSIHGNTCMIILCSGHAPIWFISLHREAYHRMQQKRESMKAAVEVF